MARLLAVAFLLASLLVPPMAEGGSSGAAPATVAASAAADQGGAPDAPLRPHGILHAGTHCVCQLADRLAAPEPVPPATLAVVVHPTFTIHALASLEAVPPARPPRA